MVNSPLIRPYFLGGVALGGGTLDSHEMICFTKRIIQKVGRPLVLTDDVAECSQPSVTKQSRYRPAAKDKEKYPSASIDQLTLVI